MYGKYVNVIQRCFCEKVSEIYLYGSHSNKGERQQDNFQHTCLNRLYYKVAGLATIYFLIITNVESDVWFIFTEPASWPVQTSRF